MTRNNPGSNRHDDELSDDDLETVAGGLASVPVPRCTVCQIRIAVYEMSICAVCFRRAQASEEREKGY